MADEPRPCIECGSPTHRIIVLERDFVNRHQVLEYAAADATAGWFTGRFPTKGSLRAELCEGCGRVTFRAVPKDRQ